MRRSLHGEPSAATGPPTAAGCGTRSSSGWARRDETVQEGTRTARFQFSLPVHLSLGFGSLFLQCQLSLAQLFLPFPRFHSSLLVRIGWCTRRWQRWRSHLLCLFKLTLELPHLSFGIFELLAVLLHLVRHGLLRGNVLLLMIGQSSSHSGSESLALLLHALFSGLRGSQQTLFELLMFSLDRAELRCQHCDSRPQCVRPGFQGAAYRLDSAFRVVGTLYLVLKRAKLGARSLKGGTLFGKLLAAHLELLLDLLPLAGRNLDGLLESTAQHKSILNCSFLDVQLREQTINLLFRLLPVTLCGCKRVPGARQLLLKDTIVLLQLRDSCIWTLQRIQLLAKRLRISFCHRQRSGQLFLPAGRRKERLILLCKLSLKR